MSAITKFDLSNLEFITNHILSHYDLEVKSVEIIKIKNSEKERAIYRVTTPHLDYCLKKVYYSVHDLEFVLYLMQYLKSKGLHVPEIVLTKQQESFVSHDHVLFFLMTWIDGVRCSYDRKNDLRLISENLAEFHLKGNAFHYLPRTKNRYNYFNWQTDFINKTNKLIKSKDRIYNDYQFNAVHEPLLSVLDLEYTMAQKSINLLEEIDFQHLLKKAVVENRYCHLDYVNKNLYIHGEKVFMIDFDRSKLDIPLHDLSSLLRRVMHRNNTNWDFSIARYILDAYDQRNSLSLDEKKAILAFLIFPEKLYKEIRRFMRQDGDESYFIEKFRKMENRSRGKDKFIQEYEDCYL
ncbi:CotS family spore coat protein [Anaerosolibacter carboniphilus]|uniref:CotS family spore coat protein n=1 Tax=Anaerosolibacter carboniphilus TaxID=1417629 RepID=A0A841KW93_9FIRM|nr:CotS family spore coat protein [Anaerosolibacter carboniphilus]